MDFPRFHLHSACDILFDFNNDSPVCDWNERARPASEHENEMNTRCDQFKS